MKKICKHHGLTEHSARTDNGGSRCRICAVEAVNKRRRKLKKLSIDYKGGKCSICNYDKCIDALDFHHLDPSIKEFNLSENGCTRSWERTKKELDKCILVCSNCHREIHSKDKNV